MVQIFQLPKGKGPAWLGSMMEDLMQRPPGPPFNQKLKFNMAGLPELVVDDNLEMEYHLRHTVLPKPGNNEQGRRLLARLHANQLDLDRPLWECHLIEGLENRRFAIYTKIHHAICDGSTFAKWMSESTTLEPSLDKFKAMWERAPARTETTPRPWLDRLQEPTNLLRTGADLSLGLGQISARLLKQRFLKRDKSVALPLSGPSTAINKPLAAARNLAFTSFPLAELKAMGRSSDASLNDVVLALCDVALRRYLSQQGQIPNKPLVAMVPVNLRKPGEQTEGNLVSSLQVKLGAPELNAVDRVKAISKSMKTARDIFSGVPAVASQTYGLLAASLGVVGSSLKLEGIMPPPLNLIISNVPGPRETRYFYGAKMTETYPISGIAPMTALNVTVYSYDGRLYFGLISGRSAVPNLEEVRLCIDEVFAEFQQELDY